MGLLALITFANVLVRYFTSQSFAWTEEFSVFLMIVLAPCGGLGLGGAQPPDPHRVSLPTAARPRASARWPALARS
jgi:hypothetical protein